ncbi:MAG TPA: hypothetical protein VI338_05145 [Nitrososphaera sp.]|nr:hypothetical protein [Nitrososphaera sp.]
MSKIETLTKRSKIMTILCAMCGLKARHVAEVNRNAMCPQCFSDYIEDRIGRRPIRIGQNTHRVRKIQTSSSRAKDEQTDTGAIAAPIEYAQSQE